MWGLSSGLPKAAVCAFHGVRGDAAPWEALGQCQWQAGQRGGRPRRQSCSCSSTAGLPRSWAGWDPSRREVAPASLCFSPNPGLNSPLLGWGGGIELIQGFWGININFGVGKHKENVNSTHPQGVKRSHIKPGLVLAPQLPRGWILWLFFFFLSSLWEKNADFINMSCSRNSSSNIPLTPPIRGGENCLDLPSGAWE